MSHMEQFQYRMLALCFGAVAVSTCAISIIIWQDYHDTPDQAVAELRAEARAVAEIAGATIGLADLVLRRLTADLPGDGLAEHVGTAEFRIRLRGLAGLLPTDNLTLAVADADGTVVATSAPVAASAASLAGYSGFHALAGGDAGPCISLPLGEGDGITVWRPLRHADGHFAGVAMARIGGGLLERLQRVVRPGAGAMAIVADVAPAGDADGILAARASVPGLPLAAVATRPLDAVLAGWRKRATRTGVLGLLFTLAAVPLTLVLMAGLRREQRAARVIRAARAEAEQASHAKSRFLAAVSHDLRQPVQGCRLFLDLLLGGTLPKHRRRQILERASEALANLEGMLHVLLDAVRLETGQIAPQLETLALDDVLIPLFNECEPQAAAKGLALRLRPARLQVVSDPLLLQRLVRNLLVNAIRYTPSGGVLVGIRRRGRVARIEVWDTGPGIAADRQDEIFEAFTRLPETSGMAAGGLGLGLAIVRGLGQALGHPVGVRSCLGRGTVFRVEVPLASPPALGQLPRAPQWMPAQVPCSPCMPSPR